MSNLETLYYHYQPPLYLSKISLPNTLDPQRDFEEMQYIEDFMQSLVAVYPGLEKARKRFDPNDEFSNITEHCAVTAEAGYQRALALGVHYGETLTVAAALFAHDINKGQEIRALKEISQLGPTNKEQIISEIQKVQKEVDKDRDQVLREEGISEEIIKLSHANMPLSNVSNIKFISIEEAIVTLCPTDILASIVHYTDCRFDGSRPRDATTRFIRSRDPYYGEARARQNYFTDEANGREYGVSHLPYDDHRLSPYAQLQLGIYNNMQQRFEEEISWRKAIQKGLPNTEDLTEAIRQTDPIEISDENSLF